MKSVNITLSALESLRAEAAAESKKAVEAHITRCIKAGSPYKSLRQNPTCNRVTVNNDGQKITSTAVVAPSRLTSDLIATDLATAATVEAASVALYRAALAYYRALVEPSDKQPSLTSVKAAYYTWARSMLGDDFAGTPADVRTALHAVLRIKTSRANGRVYELNKVTPAAVEAAFWAVVVESSWRVVEPDKIRQPAKKAAEKATEAAKKQHEQAAKNERQRNTKKAADAAAEKAEAAKKAAAEAAKKVDEALHAVVVAKNTMYIAMVDSCDEAAKKAAEKATEAVKVAANSARLKLSSAVDLAKKAEAAEKAATTIAFGGSDEAAKKAAAVVVESIKAYTTAKKAAEKAAEAAKKAAEKAAEAKHEAEIVANNNCIK